MNLAAAIYSHSSHTFYLSLGKALTAAIIPSSGPTAALLEVLILLPVTATQASPTHLSPEQSGSARLIRLRVVHWEQLVPEKKRPEGIIDPSQLSPPHSPRAHPGL